MASFHTDGRSLWNRPSVVFILLTLLASLVYSNTFSSSFQFDDFRNIVENPRIKNLSNFLDFSGTRYVGFLTFALNYRFGGLDVFGYHLVNLLIHILNGFLVYSLVSLLFEASGRESRPQDPSIALMTALLFIAHPLQTQAVAYIVQRFASLSALFYLATVVCYLRWRLASPESKRRYIWYGGALLAAVLAMKTKENSFTLPFTVLLVETVFFRPLTGRRWVSLIPFLVTLLIIPLSRMDALGEAEPLFSQTVTISRSDYLFTQFRVIMTYLRLLVLPFGQNLDYDYPVFHSLFDPPVFFSFLFLSGLFVLSVFLLRRADRDNHRPRLIAFGILWFFVTLSSEASIFPIHDLIFEHRVYLPSIGAFLISGVGWKWGADRIGSLGWRKIIGLLPLGTVILLFSLATYQRNLVWKDGWTLWKDVVRKSPGKVRGYNNLGLVYKERGHIDEAIEAYQTALNLRPGFADAHNNLGVIYKEQGRLDEAMKAYQAALRLRPGYVDAHNNLGILYEEQGRFNEAIGQYQTVLEMKPDDEKAHNNLGAVYMKLGRFDEAIREYQTALKLRSEYSDARYNLGQAYAALGYASQNDPEESIRSYQAALKLRPDFAEAHHNLGRAYAAQGKLDEAIRSYQAALKLRPDLAETHYNLGLAFRKKGLPEEARREFEAFLQLDPGSIKAQRALESLP